MSLSLVDWVALGLVASGVVFAFAGVLGIIRLPDVYTRAHATSTADTLGTVLTLGGIALVATGTGPRLKLLLLVIFMFTTSPTAAHAITRAAFNEGIEPWTGRDGGEDGG